MPDIDLVFPAESAAVRDALSAMRKKLREHDLSEMCLGTIEIVLAEACNNIVEHAYQDSGGGDIHLTLRYGGGLVVVELTDFGLPMPLMHPPHKKTHNLEAELEALPEGGFGWGLIRDMCKSLSYRRLSGQNITRMIIEATHRQT